MHRNISRRSVLAGATAASAELLFSRTLFAAATETAAQPESLNVTLTAMNPLTLRIGIAPATDEPVATELGVAASEWPAPMESPGTVRSTGPDPATVKVANPSRVRAHCHLAASTDTPSEPPSRKERRAAVGMAPP